MDIAMHSGPWTVVWILAVVSAGCGDGETAEAARDRGSRPAPADEGSGAPKTALLKAVAAANECIYDDFECEPLDGLERQLRRSEPGAEQYAAALDLATKKRVKTTILQAMRREMSDSLVPVAAEYADSHEFLVRKEAQRTLADHGSDEALRALIELLDKGKRASMLRRDVPDLLVRYSDRDVVREAVPKLREMAENDEQGWGRVHATEVVAEIRGEDALEFVLQAVERECRMSSTRAMCAPMIEILANYKEDSEAKRKLESLAESDDERVKEAAEEALAE